MANRGANSKIVTSRDGKLEVTSNDFILHMVEKERKMKNPTEMYVKFAKVMIMCQGPYSEKRINALKKVSDQFKYTSCLISDETYSKDTQMKCSYDKTEEYYSYFLNTCKKALEDGNNLIVLDPTISNIEQNRLYMAMAYKMQYVFFVAPPFITSSNKPDWKRDSQAFSFKSVKTAIDCSNMFQHLFCAWYLHDMDSFALRREAGLYVKDCLENIPEFAELFNRICPQESADSDDEWNSDYYSSYYSSGNYADEKNQVKSGPPICTPASFSKYFNLDDQRQDLAYCVVKIFHDSMRSIHDYFNRDETLEFYGKMSKLMIVGFIVSPYMIAARVKLDYKQRNLWDLDDDIMESNERQVANLVCPSELVKQVKGDVGEVDVKLIASKSNQTLVNTGKRIQEPVNYIHDFARGRSCHIVLGKAPNAPKHNIDYDVAFALSRERNFKKKNADISSTDLENCIVRRLGKFFFYLFEGNYKC